MQVMDDFPIIVPLLANAYCFGEKTSIYACWIDLDHLLLYWIQVNDLAAGLVAMGLKKGDRVGMWGPNTREWVITQFATAKAGLVLVSNCCH